MVTVSCKYHEANRTGQPASVGCLFVDVSSSKRTANCKGQLHPGSPTFDMRVCFFVLRSNLAKIAINELMKGGAFSLDARDKDTPVDFAFRSCVPRLGHRIWFRRLFAGLDSPYGEFALPTDTRRDS